MPRFSAANFLQSKPSEPGFYSSIFVRDMTTAIMPFRNGNSVPFTVSLFPRNKNLETELKAFLQPISVYQNAYTLTEAFGNAIDGIAQYLVTYGEAYMELVNNKQKLERGIRNKQLVYLPRGTVIQLPTRYLQIVPIKDWKSSNRKYYNIPADVIWHFTLPRVFGTPRQHRKMLERLKAMPDSIPPFALNSGDLGQSVRFDSRAYRYAQTVAVEQITQKWGSVLTSGLAEDATEYHSIVENMHIAHTKALLREHIISEMQTLLTKIGIENRIEVTGLKSSVDIEITIRKLEKGEIGFKEALEATRDVAI